MNQLAGTIPNELCELPLESERKNLGNSFSGEIAKTIVRAANLSALFLSKNRFPNTIPEEIGFLDRLLDFLGD
nr:receptor-like protein kinase HSL1 [Ipomoea trifida]